MDKRYAIFDMDGTLVDSMRFWHALAPEFLAARGIGAMSPALMELVRPLTTAESTALLLREYDLPDAPEAAQAEMNAVMAEHYRHDVPLKPGVKAYLTWLRSRGVRMCVASATAEPLVRQCLARLGVEDCFEFLISCESVGAGKTRPDVYCAAAARWGARPEDVAVYEDAYYAVKTAAEAGFYVVAVYDDDTAERWEEIKALAKENIIGWEIPA